MPAVEPNGVMQDDVMRTLRNFKAVFMPILM